MNNKPLISRLLRKNLNEGLIIMDDNIGTSVHKMLRGFGLKPGSEELLRLLHLIIGVITNEIEKDPDIKIVKKNNYEKI
jgi:hypothetical protein